MILIRLQLLKKQIMSRNSLKKQEAPLKKMLLNTNQKKLVN